MNRLPCFCALLSFAFLLSCAPSLDRSLLTNHGPQVVSLSPNRGARVGLVKSIDVRFSEPILETTVTDKSFIIARLPGDEPSDLQGGVAAGSLEPDSAERLSGFLTVSDDRLGVTWEPAESLSAGSYQIMLMPMIKSINHRPLNDSGFSGTQPFVSWFVVDTSGPEGAPFGGGNGAGPSPTGNSNDDPFPDTTETGAGEEEGKDEEKESDSGSGGSGENPEPGEAPQQSSETAGNAEPALPERTGLIITEVVTDPQRDWNDSSGGNGIFFDRLPGIGTIGSSDEWIELSNRSDELLSLTDWRLEMIDGTDATEFFSQPSSTLQFSRGGSVDTILPGEFVVVGNPPGDMKNTVLLRLIDNEQEMIDQINIEDANAEGIFDEAYQWDGDEGWRKGESTIGF